jgi:hypothetical protein
VWKPRLTGIQEDYYDSATRMRLAYGARASGKTWGVEQSVMRHLWRNKARVAVITKTTRQGSLGVWPELTGIIFDEWVDARVGNDKADFGWAQKPKRDPITKIHNAKVHNRYGGFSELVLFPIEHANEALDKLLSTQFSLIWISEGHLYDDRKIFDTALAQLRLPGVPFSETLLLIDTNPPETGTKHFLHDIFFKERTQTEWPEHFSEKTIAAFKERQRQMGVFRFPIESNTFLDPGLKAQIIAQYAHDIFAYRRFVLSEWIDGVTTGVFENVFFRNQHIVGNADDRNPEDWTVIFPVDTLDAVLEGGIPLLISGWDLGDVNHAWICIQPIYVRDTINFRILDEVVVTKAQMSVEEFTVLVMERMSLVRKMAGFKVDWRHFSDSSAFEFRSAIRRSDLPLDSDMTDAALVHSQSKGEILLEGSAQVKKPGWQRRRVNFVSQLLRQGRLVVSANCKMTIVMFTGLRKAAENSRTGPYLEPDQEEKHPFDALSYALSMYALDEILEGEKPSERREVRAHAMISA